MGANYSFIMNNERFKNQIKLMRVGNILQFIITSLLLMTGLLYILMISKNYINLSIAIWVIDLICLTLMLPSMILIMMGLNELRINVAPNDRKLLKAIRILTILYMVLHFVSSTVTLPIHIIDTELANITIGKNLLTFSILATSLFLKSFLFNRMQTRGYPTKMLFVPLISLPIPAIFTLVAGVISIVNFEHYAYGGYDVGYIFELTIAVLITGITLMYLSLAVFSSYLEINYYIKRVIHSVEVDSLVDLKNGEIQEIEVGSKSLKKLKA